MPSMVLGARELHSNSGRKKSLHLLRWIHWWLYPIYNPSIISSHYLDIAFGALCCQWFHAWTVEYAMMTNLLRVHGIPMHVMMTSQFGHLHEIRYDSRSFQICTKLRYDRQSFCGLWRYVMTLSYFVHVCNTLKGGLKPRLKRHNIYNMIYILY